MKRWRTAEPDPAAVARVAECTGFSVPAARAIAERGLSEPEEIDRYLRPRLSHLSDPLEMPDARPAVERIWAALDRREPILVYGDYDVDGLTGVATLVRVLGALGGSVTPCLPDRIQDGYGFSMDVVRDRLGAAIPPLIVTADCGSADADDVAAARAAGADVIVTDHHELPDRLPDATAVVNPKRSGNPAVRMLAGVGVVFKLCHALLKHGMAAGRSLPASLDLREFLPWVAVGTIADVSPLTHENRALVRHGLALLAERPGNALTALAECAGVKGAVEEYHAAFLLGPRLNAAGRMGCAEMALDLLLCDDPARMRRLAADLDGANRRRKQVEDAVLKAARGQVEREFTPGATFSITAAGDSWHVGVIGIAASRLAEAYGLPAVIVSFGEDGAGRGSCRSVEGFDLVAAMAKCAPHLASYGGHSAACGLSVSRDAWPRFREAFNAVCRESLAGRAARDELTVSAWIDLGDADGRLAREIEQMRPFGEENEAPVWAARGLCVLGQPRVVGGTHLKLLLGAGSRQIPAIGFGMAERPLPAGPMDAAFHLITNRYMGRETVELRLLDFR